MEENKKLEEEREGLKRWVGENQGRNWRNCGRNIEGKGWRKTRRNRRKETEEDREKGLEEN